MRRFAFLVLVSCSAPAAMTSPVPVCPTARAAASPPIAGRAVDAKPAVPEGAASEKLSADKALERVVTSREAQAAWFAKAFLDKVSASQVTSLVTKMGKDLGAFQKVEKDGSAFKAVYANGFVPSRIHLDSSGHIDGLFFGPPEPTKARPLADVLAEIGKLPGKVSVLVTTGSKVDGEIAPDAELAVGSAFKLAILAALEERVRAKKLTWAHVVPLEARHKSLPSGFLQKWPDGAPLTVYSLASLMISQSDNTATDALLDLAGRPAVEKLAPGNAPFLGTRDAFVLKYKGGEGLLAKWRAEGEAGRRKLLADIAKAPLPAVDDVPHDTVSAIDVEWRLSARRLCDLLGRTKDLPMLHINPGIAAKKDWDSIAYKGGSEPGVLNLSSLVEKGGKLHCVVATWNAEQPFDDSKLMSLYGQLLAAER